jgi:hypothetical protein
MPARIFLSPVKKQDRTLPTPPEGRWHSQADFLVKYSSDILIEGKVDDRQFVHSVPTVFARPIQFSQALEDSSHPAHASLTGQWRGLLAVFALQRWLAISLDLRIFDLAALFEPRQVIVGEGGGADFPFLSVLQSQLPPPEEEWQRWWLVYCRGELLGATSPRSILYTPAEYNCPSIIPWRRNGKLIDPIAYYDPDRKRKPARELALLATWVDRVREHESERWGVAEKPHLDNAMAMVKRELDAWRQDLMPYREEMVGRLSLEQAEPLVREEPYRHFFRPVDIRDQQAPSDLLLRTNSAESVLALSRTALKPTKRVYGPVLVEQLDLSGMKGPTGVAKWRTPAGLEIPHSYLIAEEAFFPPKLAEVELSDQAYTPGVTEFALPLTPLFFHYFSLEALLEGRFLTEFVATDKRVTVRLRLPLSGDEDLFVERHYDRETEVFSIEGGIPGFSIWPDFVDEAWRHNFALMAAPSKINLVVAPITCKGDVLPACASDGTEDALRIWASESPVVGFSLALRDGVTGKTTDAGVILRNSLPKPQQRSTQWTVAVDFGTSSTHLMARDGEHAGERALALRSRKVLLSNASSANSLAVERDIYPAYDVTPPFPTLLAHSSATLVKGNESGLVREGEFLPYFRLDISKLESMIKDLKWPVRGASQAEIPLRAYLTAVVRAVVCEARAAGARSLDFQWSYPLALPADVQRWLTLFWGGISRFFSIEGELAVTAGAGTSESEALCRHLSEFSALPIHADSLSIAIDIGGGSSDIGFWSARRLLDQISLKLAGNDILVPLAAHPGFLPGLSSICAPGDDPEETVRLMTRNPDSLAAMINTLLVQAIGSDGKRFTGGDPRLHPMPQALVTRLQAAESPWSEARSLIYLFVTGLSFYAGLHARTIFGERVNKGTVTLVFGGRGSALLTWLERGDPIRDLIRSAFLEGLTLERDQFRGTAVDVFSPANWYEPSNPLKGEVVRGLLRAKLGGEMPVRPSKVLIGEKSWWLNNPSEPLSWDTEVDDIQLGKLNPPPNLDSGHAAHFLARVVPLYALNLGLDEQGLGRLRLDTARVVDFLRKTLADGQKVLQPVFAAELKVLMDNYVALATGDQG